MLKRTGTFFGRSLHRLGRSRRALQNACREGLGCKLGYFVGRSRIATAITSRDKPARGTDARRPPRHKNYPPGRVISTVRRGQGLRRASFHDSLATDRTLDPNPLSGRSATLAAANRARGSGPSAMKQRILKNTGIPGRKSLFAAPSRRIYRTRHYRPQCCLPTYVVDRRYPRMRQTLLFQAKSFPRDFIVLSYAALDNDLLET